MTDYEPGHEYRPRRIGWLAAIVVVAMIGGCVAAAWAAVPRDGAVRDAVESVEVNAYYDYEARLIFRQLIWRNEWDQIIAWRLVKADSMLPRKEGRLWVCRFDDGGTLRAVNAKAFSESFLQYDPEVLARDWFPKDQRVELTVPRRAK